MAERQPNGPALWCTILAAMPPRSIIAGGAVRDYLLGYEPKDIDVFSPPDPVWRIPDGFEGLGNGPNDAVRRAEYEAMTNIDIVVRGEVEGWTVDLVGVTFTTPAELIGTFDFGVTRCWADAEGQVHDTPEAERDRLFALVTRLIHDRPDRAQARFDRFNARMGGGWRYVISPDAHSKVE